MKYRNLEKILSDQYGVRGLAASRNTVLWALDKMPVDQAQRELKALNARRRKLGVIPVYVPYGHAAF